MVDILSRPSFYLPYFGHSLFITKIEEMKGKNQRIDHQRFFPSNMEGQSSAKRVWPSIYLPIFASQ